MAAAWEDWELALLRDVSLTLTEVAERTGRLRQVNDLDWLVTLCAPCHTPRPEHFWKEIPEDVILLIGGGGDATYESH